VRDLLLGVEGSVESCDLVLFIARTHCCMDKLKIKSRYLLFNFRLSLSFGRLFAQFSLTRVLICFV
jgi:hypothetical protein